MKTRKIRAICQGERVEELLEAIAFEDRQRAGTFQIIGEGELLGFVLPDGNAVEVFDLGNVAFARCEETTAHTQTLRRYCTEDFSKNESRTLTI